MPLASGERAGGETGLQVKQNKDAGSCEGSAGLPWFQGNTGGTQHHCWVQDHLTTSAGAISSAQETLFFPVSLKLSPRVEGARTPLSTLGTDAQSSWRLHDVWSHYSAALVVMLFL